MEGPLLRRSFRARRPAEGSCGETPRATMPPPPPVAKGPGGASVGQLQALHTLIASDSAGAAANAAAAAAIADPGGRSGRSGCARSVAVRATLDAMYSPDADQGAGRTGGYLECPAGAAAAGCCRAAHDAPPAQNGGTRARAPAESPSRAAHAPSGADNLRGVVGDESPRAGVCGVVVARGVSAEVLSARSVLSLQRVQASAGGAGKQVVLLEGRLLKQMRSGLGSVAPLRPWRGRWFRLYDDALVYCAASRDARRMRRVGLATIWSVEFVADARPTLIIRLAGGRQLKMRAPTGAPACAPGAVAESGGVLLVRWREAVHTARVRHAMTVVSAAAVETAPLSLWHVSPDVLRRKLLAHLARLLPPLGASAPASAPASLGSACVAWELDMSAQLRQLDAVMLSLWRALASCASCAQPGCAGVSAGSKACAAPCEAGMLLVSESTRVMMDRVEALLACGPIQAPAGLPSPRDNVGTWQGARRSRVQDARTRGWQRHWHALIMWALRYGGQVASCRAMLLALPQAPPSLPPKSTHRSMGRLPWNLKGWDRICSALGLVDSKIARVHAGRALTVWSLAPRRVLAVLHCGLISIFGR